MCGRQRYIIDTDTMMMMMMLMMLMSDIVGDGEGEEGTGGRKEGARVRV